ncbi:hypothetical protein CPB84DRAFT_1847834 [Gymnopilus junonius]|uniref:Uncharacterized protein n=1 Tax=Gymnopilus junonius TaxID=109634 RepID=A0A9P5TMT3_GYMJU|nr:hypothetical protein CPB84DRAFT_1847834 [Gymnopilus junonius]
MPQQTPPLDHSRGRAFISDGDIYYSPNCSRSVAVPNRNPSYPFAVGAASLRRHQTPEWWTDAFGFLSFTPSVPSFEGYAFGHLCDYLNNIDEVDAPWGTGYQLQQSKSSAWCYLEDILIVILHILREKFFLRLKPYFLPPPPLSSVSTKCFLVLVVHAIELAAHAIGEPDPLQVPDWFNFLASEKEVDQLWLSTLRCHNERFGDRPVTLGPSSISPTKVAKVPISTINAPYHLRANRCLHPTFLTTLSPVFFQNWSLRRPGKRILPPSHGNPFSLLEKSLMIECLRMRRRRIGKRLSRERKNPTISAEVFVWDWSIEEDMCLVRTRVHKKECEDNLAFYRGSQARYDSFQNEWDLCEYFATPGDPDCISDDDDDGTATLALTSETIRLPPILATLPILSRKKLRNLLLDVSKCMQVSFHYLRLLVDIVAYLSTHYGYRPPIAIPPNPSTPDKARWNDLVKTGLQTTNGPPPVIYDLKHQCPIALNIAALRLLFQKVGDLFLLQGSCLALDPQAPWTIALTTATDAVKVFRLVVSPGKHSSMSLAASWKWA